MKNWIKKKLSDLSKRKDAVISGPFGSNLKVSDYKASGIPIFRLQNVGKGYFINKDIKYISEEKAEELKYHSFKSGDLVLAKLGVPIGKTCVVPEEFQSGIIVADVVRIRPDKNIVDYKFLQYFLNSDQAVSQLTANVTGATRPRVNLSDVRNMELYVPPLSEQERIVSILDRAFTAINQAKSNAERNLKNATALFESYLHSILETLSQEHPQTTLSKSCDFFNGKAHEKAIDDSSNYVVVNSKFISSEGKTVKRTANQMFPLYTNDVVLVMSDVPNGKALAKCMIIEEDDTYSLNQRICCIRSESYDTKFLYYQLNRNPYLLAFNNGENQTNLRKGDILDTPLTLPEIRIQKDVASKIDNVKDQSKQLCKIYQKKINALDELKKSLLQKAFEGELYHDEATKLKIENELPS